MALKFKLPKIKKTIEKNIKLNNENLCCVPFFKKADLIAITKSSLLVSIIFNTQIAWMRKFLLDLKLFLFQLPHMTMGHQQYELVNQFR